jgi:hypothetical protein
MSKIRIGQAYQPTRITRRGPSGSYSAYRPMTGHLPPERHDHNRIDRIVFAASVLAWVALAVLMLAGIIT